MDERPELWQFREGAGGQDIAGYDVVATDGDIGRIDDAVFAEGASRIIVDTGFWILGRRRSLLPAGVIERVDHGERRVYVDRSKEQIKHAPELGDQAPGDQGYLAAVGAYYAEPGRGARRIP